MDIDFLLMLQGFRESTNGMLNGLFLGLSAICSGPVAFIIPTLVLWCISKEAGSYICFSFSIGTVVNQAVKNTCCIYRPWVRDPRVLPVSEAVPSATGYSFPSGHCAIATSVFGGLAASFSKHRWLVASCAVLVALVGFSRSYLGVHTPQDVLVSIALGCLILFVVWRLLRWVGAAPGRDGWLLLGCEAAAFVLLAYEQLKPYPLDYVGNSLLVDPYSMITDCYMASGCLAGYALAWFLERRLVSFSVDGTPLVRAVRLLAGCAIMGVLYLLGAPVIYRLLGRHVGVFVVAFITMCYVGVLYPALFMWVRRRRMRRLAAAG